MVPNTKTARAMRYSLAAIFLHWLIAAALLFQIALGLGLEDLGAKAFAQYQLHKSVGMAILLLSLLRFGLRLALPRPPSLESGFPGFLASSVHAGLYVFMIGAPLTGWMLVSTAEIKVPTLIFGTVPLPHLPLPDGLHAVFSGAHEVAAFLGLALIALHIAGALRHHWLLRDGLLYRMTPVRSWLVAALLIVLVPAGWAAGRAMLTPQESAPVSPRPLMSNPAPAQPVENGVAPAAEAEAETGTDAATQAEATAEEQPEEASPEAVLPPRWTILPGGRLDFTASYRADSYKGAFSRWSGTIVMDPDRPETADIRIEIDMMSANMGDATQTSMLLGEDFFAASQFAKAVFRTSKVRKTGPDSFQADGTLSMKGVTAAQTLRFALSGTGARRHVTGSATIDRNRFDVGTGTSAQGIAPSVTVNFAFDASTSRAQ